MQIGPEGGWDAGTDQARAAAEAQGTHDSFWQRVKETSNMHLVPLEALDELSSALC